MFMFFTTWEMELTGQLMMLSTGLFYLVIGESDCLLVSERCLVFKVFVLAIGDEDLIGEMRGDLRVESIDAYFLS